MADLNKIVEDIEKLTVVEVSELVKMLEEKFGVSAAAPVMMAGAAAPAAEADAAPKNVTVVMSSFGDSKVAVIKVVREITGLGLVDAKKLVDALPAEIKKDVPADEAEKIKKSLTDAGATVEFK